MKMAFGSQTRRPFTEHVQILVRMLVHKLKFRSYSAPATSAFSEFSACWVNVDCLFACLLACIFAYLFGWVGLWVC